ncbi:MAG: VOC family protein [Verrucomicrobiota bacterium]
MITSIAFYVYPVTDIARARHFYENVLGLKLESNFRDEWIEYDLNGGTFAITTTDATHQAGIKGGVIAFEVDDLDSEIARLKAQPVKFVMETCETPVCRFAVVNDPDGNELIIHKRKV